MACRGCSNEKILNVFNFGEFPYGDSYRKEPSEIKHSTYYPLELVRCPNCLLLQLPTSANFDEQYTDYLYFTSNTKHLNNYYSLLAQDVSLLLESPGKSKTILDIGSNDGSFLMNFRKYGFEILGIEPSLSAFSRAKTNGIPTINSVFNKSIAEELSLKFGTFDVISLNYVLANITDLENFLIAINLVSNKSTLLSIVTGYHVDQFQVNMFEYINHDHMTYFTLNTLSSLLKRFGWKVTRAERVEHKGGSLHVFATQYTTDTPVEASVHQITQRERWLFADGDQLIYEMLGRIDYAKDFTTSLLKAYSGKILVGIGASISASYLAHYFRIENNFKYLFDDDPRKIGLIAPGTNTPVRDLKEVGNTENSLAIILSWQHTEILLTRLREERFTGNVLVPLPFPYIFNL